MHIKHGIKVLPGWEIVSLVFNMNLLHMKRITEKWCSESSVSSQAAVASVLSWRVIV